MIIDCRRAPHSRLRSSSRRCFGLSSPGTSSSRSLVVSSIDASGALRSCDTLETKSCFRRSSSPSRSLMKLKCRARLFTSGGPLAWTRNAKLPRASSPVPRCRRRIGAAIDRATISDSSAASPIAATVAPQARLRARRAREAPTSALCLICAREIWRNAASSSRSRFDTSSPASAWRSGAPSRHNRSSRSAASRSCADSARPSSAVRSRSTVARTRRPCSR